LPIRAWPGSARPWRSFTTSAAAGRNAFNRSFLWSTILPGRSQIHGIRGRSGFPVSVSASAARCARVRVVAVRADFAKNYVLYFPRSIDSCSPARGSNTMYETPQDSPPLHTAFGKGCKIGCFAGVLISLLLAAFLIYTGLNDPKQKAQFFRDIITAMIFFMIVIMGPMLACVVMGLVVGISTPILAQGLTGFWQAASAPVVIAVPLGAAIDVQAGFG